VKSTKEAAETIPQGRPGASFPLVSGVPPTTAVGARNNFQQVAAWIFEIKASAAVVTVDLAQLGARRIGPVGKVALSNTRKDLVKLRFAHQESIVLCSDLVFAIHEIDVDAVRRCDDLEGAPLRGGGRFNMSARNAAEALLSREKTMV
jgi:hypothetical protein